MKKFLIYFLAAVLTFLGSMIVLAPAKPIWQLVSDKVAVPNFKVLQVQGTIWKGQANLQYQQFPASWLTWQLEPLSLITRAIDVKFRIAGDGHDFDGEAHLEPSGFVLSNLQGILQSQYMNKVSQPQGLSFTGEITASNFGIISDLKWFNDAAGHISWPGGRIVSMTSAGTRVFDLPPLEGDLKLIEDHIQLLIHYQQNELIDIQLKPDGWIVVAIKARLFTLAQLPLPSGIELHDTMLKFEEKIF